MVRIAIVVLALSAAPISAAPNIVFILADDLGPGDIGPYGQKIIRTPNLDRLAREGMTFQRHYSGNNVCAPSRAVLMTGLHPGHAPIRDNREVKPEGQFPLPANSVTLPKLLQASGYATGAFGKWGLGAPQSEGEPLRQGFQRFYGYNCQRVAHNHYPTYLWNDASRVMLGNAPFPAHDTLKPNEDPANAASYQRFRGTDYAPDRITEQALAFVNANHQRPFFLYWPTTIPHLALQVPADSFADYAGRQHDPKPYIGGRGYLPNPEPRATYAAMIARMDRDIGKLLDQLQTLGLAQNTLVVFTSDNGPIFDQLTNDPVDYFTSAMNRKGRKGSMDEGGVRVPCLVRWPGVIPAGTTTDFMSGFEDWLPTFLQAAGQPIPPGLDGISLMPTLQGKSQDARAFLYRESPGYGGQQAVWAGEWKAVRRGLNPRNANAKLKPITTELYHLSKDPQEANDLAAVHPDQLQRLEQILRREHVPNPNFPIRRLDAVP